jgi:hypothetical protein
MDGNLLRNWLGLPPGPWPPDDRTLLGLPEHADPAEVERRALLLMGRLRPHQLLHPELVTEGMNRLAQAMLAVTSFGVSKPTAKPQPVPSAPAVPIPKGASAPKPVEAFDFGPSTGVQAPAAPLSGPEVLDAEPVVLDAEAIPAESGQNFGPVRRRYRSHSADQSLRSLLPDLPEFEKPRIGPTAGDRRKIYRELVGWRALLQAWEGLKPWMADSTVELDSPAAIFDFLEAIDACRKAQKHRGLRYLDWRDEAPFVQVLIDQPQTLPVFRALVYGQRQGLATDWARAKSRWEDVALELRLAIRRTVRDLPRPFIKSLFRWLAQNPEWLLGFASVVVILTALLRMLIAVIGKSSAAGS